MSQPRITLTGWPAVAALVLVAGFLGWSYLASRQTLDTQAGDELKNWLKGEYAGKHLAELRATTPENSQAAVDRFLDGLNGITFTSLTARGRGDDIVVRAEIRINGQPPGDGRAVRYFRMVHAQLTGWRYRNETTAWSYYLKVF